MKWLRFAAFVWVLVSPALASPQTLRQRPVKRAPTKPSAADVGFSILEEVHALAQELPTERRISVLAEICEQSSGYLERAKLMATSPRDRQSAESQLSVGHRTLLKAWAEELYLLGNEFPAASRQRVIAHAAATRAMAYLDSGRALEMLDAFDPAGEPQDGRQPLLDRIFGAVFEGEGIQSVPKLRLKAQQIGSNGTYPYRAVTELMAKLETHPEIVRPLFDDLLAAFRQESNTNSVNGLLGALWVDPVRAALEPAQLNDALSELVERTKALAPELPNNIWLSRVRASLKLFAPEAAAQIPDAPVSRPSPTLAKATALKPTNARPVRDEEAARLSAEFEQTRSLLMAMREQENYTQDELRQTIEKGVERGTAMVSAVAAADPNPDRLVALMSAVPPLLDFVQASSGLDLRVTLACVRQVQDSELRARLLLTAASIAGRN